jgi:hypothetical protein
MAGFEDNFRLGVVKKREDMVKKNEVLGYSDRIVIRAEEIVVDQLMRAGLDNMTIRESLELIQERLSDEKYVGKYRATWQKMLSTADDAEETEENLAKGLAKALKDELDFKNFPMQKAA